MIKTILVDQLHPSQSKTVSSNEIGVLLTTKNLRNCTILVCNNDVVNTISPHEIAGGVYEIQRTINLLTKPMELEQEITIPPVREQNEASFTITDIASTFDVRSPADLRDFDFGELDRDHNYDPSKTLQK